jgi:hypothetical protein
VTENERLKSRAVKKQNQVQRLEIGNWLSGREDSDPPKRQTETRNTAEIKNRS